MSQTGVVSWSQTAASNATADSTVNWQEGQAPSSVNDSARAGMASVAKWRDDISGAIVTGGTSTAYTVTSYQSFSSLSVLANQVVAFTPHTTCSSPVTLNVDSLGAKPLRSSPGIELPAGTIIQGTPYLAVYNASDASFYLQSFFGNPYGIPIGAMIDFAGSSAPNSSFVLPYGQAISRSTYSALFSLISTTYGTGDGSTTFNIPDLRGRVVAGKDDMGGSAASRLTSSYFGGTATNLGATGGNESHTLTSNQLASHSHSITDPGHLHTVGMNLSGDAAGASLVAQSGGFQYVQTSNTNTSSSTTGISINNAGGGTAHNNTQPTIILNKLIRII